MALGSGKYGVVNGVTKVRDWSMSIIDSGEVFKDSATRAGSMRGAGVVDSNGQFSVNDGTPVIYPGAYFAFKGYPLPTSGVFGTVGVTWLISNAILDSFSSTWNWGKTQTLTSVYNFSQGTACPTFGSEIVLDATLVTPSKMCATPIKVSTDYTNYFDYINAVSATFTLTCANQESNNSGLACCTRRYPGNIDWTLSITEENDYNIITQAGQTAVIGNIKSFRLYVTPTAYWQLKWGILQSWTDLVVDRDTGRIVQKTCNYGMTGLYNGAVGSIIAPSTSTIWPA